MVGPKWYDERNDGSCRQWARDISDILKREMETAKMEGKIKPDMEGVGRYGNYDGEIGGGGYESEFFCSLGSR